MPDITPNIAAYEARAAAGEKPRMPWDSMCAFGGNADGYYASIMGHRADGFDSIVAAKLCAEDLLLAAVGPLVAPLLAAAREDGARDMRERAAKEAEPDPGCYACGRPDLRIRAIPLTEEETSPRGSIISASRKELLETLAANIEESHEADRLLDDAVTSGLAATVADLEDDLDRYWNLARCSCCNRFRKGSKFHDGLGAICYDCAPEEGS